MSRATVDAYVDGWRTERRIPRHVSWDQVPHLVKVKLVSELAGVHLGTVYGWIDNGTLEHVRLGRLLFVPKAAVKKLLAVTEADTVCQCQTDIAPIQTTTPAATGRRTGFGFKSRDQRVRALAKTILAEARRQASAETPENPEEA